MKSQSILVTGSTGYVGGRLIPLLLESGYRVRAMARSIEKLDNRSWLRHSLLELVQVDVLDLQLLEKALYGCWAAYYLIHSMNPQEKKFEATDRKAANNMVFAASKMGLKRIIYLGGLGDLQHNNLSRHLRSRHEVAHILQNGSVPTTFFRAAMILSWGT